MSLGKTVHVLSPRMAGIGQVVLEVRAAIVSYINSSFLAKFRFPVTQEDETLLKTFTITKLSVRETELSSPEKCVFIYITVRINKKRDKSFEISLIPSTVDLSKHLITA